jgi:hypothetical protein
MLLAPYGSLGAIPRSVAAVTVLGEPSGVDIPGAA